MTGTPAGPSPHGMWLGLGIAVAGVVGCDSPTVVASLPPLPPPPPSLDLGDERRTASCGNVGISAGPPRRLAIDTTVPGNDCPYALGFEVSIETDAGEAMIADFLREYAISDWSVHRTGSGFRHDFRLYWELVPWDKRLRASLPERQPLVILPCPENEGQPVLACYEDACESYEDVGQVRPYVPSGLGLIWRSPWAFASVQQLREGETLRIPVRYAAHRHMERARLTAFFSSYHARPPESLTWAELYDGIGPERQLGPLRAGDSGTVTFEVIAKPGGLRSEAELVHVEFEARGAGCVLDPHPIQIRVVSPP